MAAVGSNRLLELTGIGKQFPNVQALDGVDLEVRAGEVLALLGENGAGKSTLLRIVSGDYKPDRGAIVFDGEPQAFASTRDAHKCGIRVIYQEAEIIDGVSVSENLFAGELPRRFGRFVDRGALDRQTAVLLEQLGFENELDPYALGETLNSAQRQLVEIARAMKAATRLLALDEPTSSLTTVEIERLFAIISRLRADGVAVIYVSHRMNEIMRLADRVAVLRDGRLVAVRSISETSEAELVELMVGRPLSSIFGHQAQVTEEVALEVRGLTTSWLSDVTFKIRRGEVVGLAGLAGAGRSELAKALFGLVSRSSGGIAIYGHETVVNRPSDAVNAGIAYLPEDRKREGLVLMRSVRENISLASLDKVRRFRFIRSREERALVTKTVEGLRIKTPSLEQEVSKLSGGNQQKVLLARSLVRQPKVLILDEPTRGIDVATKTEIYRLIERLTADGVAVLFISSELPEVIGVSDRILVMQNGRITGELAASDASEKEILRLAMVDHLSAKGSAAA